jgi:hypothetical protein
LAGPFSALGAGSVSIEAFIAKKGAWYAVVQDAIAGCMAEHGFEYYPVKYEDIIIDAEPVPPPQDIVHVPYLPVDRELVATHGYGLDLTPDPETVAAEQAEQLAAANAKNDEYRLSLTEEGRIAYDEAMEGNDPEAGALGCAGTAIAANPEPDYGLDLAFHERYRELRVAMEGVGRQMTPNDPRVRAAAEAWSTCMSSRGVDLSAPSDGDPANGFSAFANPEHAWRLAWATGSSGEGGTNTAASPDGTRAEAAIALADFDCRLETDYLDTVQEVQRELGRQFYEDNRAQIEALLAGTDLQ